MTTVSPLAPNVKPINLVCDFCDRQECARLRRGACDRCYMIRFAADALDTLNPPTWGWSRRHYYAPDTKAFRKIVVADERRVWGTAPGYAVLDQALADQIQVFGTVAA